MIFYLCFFIFQYIYIYVYIYIETHTHIYIYIYISNCLTASPATVPGFEGLVVI